VAEQKRSPPSAIRCSRRLRGCAGSKTRRRCCRNGAELADLDGRLQRRDRSARTPRHDAAELTSDVERLSRWRSARGLESLVRRSH